MDRRRFVQASVLAALGACTSEASAPIAQPEGTTPPAPSLPPPATPSAGDVPASIPEEPPPSPDAEADRPAQPGADPSAAPEDAPPSTLGVLCRDAWGAAPAGAGFVEHRIRQMTVHHSAVVLGDNRKAPSRLRQHQRHHQNQGWPDIAYHLGVDRHGNAYDLRPHAFRGDTFTNYDPSGHFLVLAEGDFDREQPTDAQLEAIAQAFAWATGAFGVPAATLSGHRDHAQTSCPGDAMYARLGDLRARVEQLAAAGVERHDRCGPEASAYVQQVEAGQA